MDEEKRIELKGRRTVKIVEATARDRVAARADFVRSVPILAALEQAGEDYDSGGYRELPSRLNGWAHDPHRFAIREDSCADLPIDPAARDAAILAHLRARLSDDALVTVILRREALVIALRLPILARHVSTLFDTGRGDWLAFAAPPADWVVATLHRDAVGQSEIVTGRLPPDDPS